MPKTPAPFSDECLEQLAESFHEDYREKQRGKKDVDDPAMKPWRLLDDTFKRSNLDLASDIPRKLKRINAEITSEKTNQAFAFATDEVEALAADEHDRWNHERLGDGWTFAPERNPDQKQTPFLVHYDELPEDIKEYDRDMIRAIPGALARVGYSIRRLVRPRVFVVRSFATPGLNILLEGAIEKSQDEFLWDIPAITDGTPAGEIFRDVRHRLYAAHHVLACVDEPNGNVGFEIGHALGRGARLALFHVEGHSPPRWLQDSPFESYGAPLVGSSDDLLELLRNTTETERIAPAALGERIAVLAPPTGPSAEIATWIARDARERGDDVRIIQQPEWNWRDAPTELAHTGRILFCFERPQSRETDGDGAANTVNAALAGYLGAHIQRNPIVLQDRSTERRLVDFGGWIRTYAELSEARNQAARHLDATDETG